MRRLADIDASDVPRFSTGIERIRPRARRRSGAGRRGADRRRSGHRQIDAAAAVAGGDRRATNARSISAARNRARRSRCARSGLRCWSRARRRASCNCWPRSSSKKSRRRSPTERPDVAVIDSIQTVYSDALTSAPGLGRAGARVRGATDAHRQAVGHHHHHGRPRDQGRRARRAARARAYRRYGAVLRGRHAFLVSAGARDQEPLRRGQRTRRVRHDRARLARRGQSVGAVSVAARADRCRVPACW